MTETRFGERLFAVNLARLMEVGTPVISEVVMGLVYGRKLRKSGLAFQYTVFSLGMEGGSTSEKMLLQRGGVVFFLPLPF